MRVNSANTKIKGISIKANTHDEDNGYQAVCRIQVEILLPDAAKVKESDLSGVIDQLHKASKVVGTAGKNTTELKLKREFGPIEHRFSGPKKNEKVSAHGEIKFVTYRMVEGVLQLKYNFDTTISLKDLAMLVSLMDSFVKLSTTTSQLDILDGEAVG